MLSALFPCPVGDCYTYDDYEWWNEMEGWRSWIDSSNGEQVTPDGIDIPSKNFQLRDMAH